MEKKKKPKTVLGHNESLYLVQHRANTDFFNVLTQGPNEMEKHVASPGAMEAPLTLFPCRVAHAQLSSFSPHSVALYSVWHRGCCSNACPIFFNTAIQVCVTREQSTGLGMQCLKVICSS